MSEQKKNPWLEENFVGGGGGLWDGKTVTVLSSKTMIDFLSRGDGTPVIDPETGKQSYRHVLMLTGIADDDEMERREGYSAGKTLLPTADGEGFVNQKGQDETNFNRNSEISKFAAAIRAGGFDMSRLWDAEKGKMKASGLTGARFTFKGVPRHDREGKEKVNKKGYVELKFYPVEFLGFKAGVGSAPGGAPNELREKAVGVVVSILAEADGKKVSRADLVRKLSSKLSGDADANKVLALVTRDDFHTDVPWVRDATGFTLS